MTLDAELTNKPKLPKIWYMPILAVLIGVAMVFNHWRNKGHEIEITFKTAEGLEANVTKVKFKNVEVGLLKNISFNEDASNVKLKVSIYKEMGKFLKEDTKFWVVKPRVGVGGISGIGTLLSGSYIEMSKGESVKSKFKFKGLEDPPITPSSVKGLRIKLISKGGKTVRTGSSVTYRNFNVGIVEKFFFDTEKRQAVYDVFIKSPYDALVTTNTQFWNSGGVSIRTGAGGLKFEVDTVESIVTGGISFDVIDGQLGEKVTAVKDFILYPSKEAAQNRREYKYLEYVILASSSVSGLQVGAPVDYRGVQLGVVVNPAMNFLKSKQIVEKYNLSDNGEIPIVVRIEPARIALELEDDMEKFKNTFNSWLKRGLSASIKSSNLITGSLKVSLDLTDKKLKEIDSFGPYPVIPIGSGGIEGQLEDVLAKINRLPFEGALNDLRAVLKGFKPGSEAYEGINISLNKLQETLDSFQPVLKSLGNNPSSLIFGKTKKNDIIPKAKQ